MAWNCRGSGGSTVPTLNHYLQCTDAKLAFISETRCGLQRANQRIKGLSLNNSIVVSSNGKSGGLWLIWDDSQAVSLISKNINLIAARVKGKGPHSDWILICIYGDPSRYLNPFIWEQIDNLIKDEELPVLCIGDFNAISSMDEKWGGSDVFKSGNMAFRNWVNESGLIDLGHKGPAYTWTNKKSGYLNISERLDRALSNLEWTLQYPNSAVYHIPRFNSDHLPILLRPNPVRKTPKAPFRCENWWSVKPDFQSVCEKAVHQQTSWLSVQRRFKSEALTWVKKNKSPNLMLKEIETEMLQLNATQPDLVDRGEEARVNEEHARCLLMREMYWHQRSRIKWAALGDRNSAFFHASTITRRRRNAIGSLLVSGTVWVTEETEIKRAFVDHFKAIYSKGQRTDVHSVYGPTLLLNLPKIPAFIGPSLDSIPTDLEIHKALMQLGPHKAAGPDGFNAFILQQQWDLFGPTIITEVKEFFLTGIMKPEIAKSNLILIPKVKDPCQVADYRPISVCNVLYKVISKILTSRLKPYIAGCISASQSAFVPGREISENVILLREVLHSFKSPSYSSSDFSLKVDLSKAFDRMDWDYLEAILKLYGLPPRMSVWIMSYVRSSEFSIVLNGGGGGGGSLKPTCGLRQGCSLSPYLFILGMDLLSRSLAHLVQGKWLHGVKLEPSSDPITDILYANDLLLLGRAQPQEALQILQVLDAFSAVSGQQIGPAKSSIWFSHPTGQQERINISGIFGVNREVVSSSYLGAPIITNAQGFDFLVEAVSSKLNSWKSRMLSQAGRIVLIKSVLQALPIYFMATAVIPVKIIKKLNGLIRKFFWGKVDKQHYMALLAWEKVSAPISMGGLGLRDLQLMNKAMLLKMLWRMAAGSESLWVKQLQAKYLPRSKLWLSKRTSKCTSFWRGILALRDNLQPMVSWKLGDGSVCTTFAQPWFPQALLNDSQTRVDRSETVNELVDEVTGNWDVNQISGRFGYAAALWIVSNLRPPSPGRGPDKLIFSLSSNGDFSVKKAYAALLASQTPSSGTSVQGVSETQLVALWKRIWHGGSMPPRLRVFIWKLAHGALPLGQTMANRLKRGDPTCLVCGQREEDALHLAFLCPFARSCWLAGNLAIKSDCFHSSIKRALVQLMELVPIESWHEACMTLWAIWRTRNALAFQGKHPSFETYRSYVLQIEVENSFARVKNTGHRQNQNLQVTTAAPLPTVFSCRVDGSWAFGWVGGIGFILAQGNMLRAYKMERVTACCPLQAEAIALLQGVEYAISIGLSDCSFIIDNSTLAIACSDLNPPLEVDWRAHREIFDVWKKMRSNRGFTVLHESRENNGIADSLAKRGRRMGDSFLGFTYPMFPPWPGSSADQE
ncbi:uncharacterized protein LOC144568653 [Carex rostrata]